MSILLASNRCAHFTIVISPDAPMQADYAAKELRYYLDLITAADFEITQAPFQGPQILLKAGDAALGDDGFDISTKEHAVVISGGKRGIIYGVYEFLEHLGCRFFTSSCEKVPCQSTLQMEPLSTRQLPAFEFRDHNYYDFIENPRFAVRSRLNGHFMPIQEKHGGHMPYTWFVHTFDHLIPASEFGQAHPEYFAMYDGKRKVSMENSQLCLSNPELLSLGIQRAREVLRAHPETSILSLSQNDWTPGCQCEKCLAIDQEEGSPAGTLLHFVNGIAQALEEEFPHVIFDTLAYTYTRPVPLKTKPRHNVCIRLCSIECCFSHPFETCDDERGVTLPDGRRSSFIGDLQAWGQCHDRLYIWDYTTCFAHYPTPHPNWRTLQPNMQSFARNHVKGVFEQANGAKRGGTDFNELRAYVISKLLWNPWCDVEKHIQEFTDYYYGAAAPYVREYIGVLCDKADKDNIHVGFNDNPVSPLFDNTMLDRLEDILQNGKNAVQGDALRLWRMEKALLSIRWVRMKRQAMLENQLSPEEVNRFFTDWKAFGLSRIDEWVSMESTHRALLKNVWRGTDFYAHWTAEGPEEF